MNEPDFDEFLLGAADDQKHRVCEDLLSNPETIVSLQSTLADDSLISALRMAGDSIQDNQDPDGRFVLTWGKSTFESYSKSQSRNLRVIDLEDPDRVLPIMNLAWISEAVWSNDGSLLIVRGIEWDKRGSHDTSKVIDLKRWNERVVEGLPLESAAYFQEWNDGFVCSVVKTLKQRPRVSKRKVGYFAIKEDSNLSTIVIFRTFNRLEIGRSATAFDFK